MIANFLDGSFIFSIGSVFGQESGLNRAIKLDVSEVYSVYGEGAVYADVVAQKWSDGGEGDIRRSGSIRRWKG